MSLGESQLQELLELAKGAALKAGELIASYQGSIIETNLKETGTSLASQVVTEVDIKAEKAILEILTPTRAQYDLGLLTEETPDDGSRFEKDYFWCIDPLDGTLPFSQNLPGYGTSIALVSQKGEAILGVVNDPRGGNLYYALKENGAFKNDKPFCVENTEAKVHIINGPGGAVMQAIATIEKAPCVFYKRPKKEQGGGCLWDYAATAIIIKEAGGDCRDYSFTSLNLNSSKSLFMNHCGVIYFAGLTQEQAEEHSGR